MLLRKAPGNNQFVLQHLLGTNPVLYTATGWLKATRENPVAKSAITILQESTRCIYCRFIHLDFSIHGVSNFNIVKKMLLENT